MAKDVLTPLHLSEMRGMPCPGGQYELRVTTPGPMTGRHLRNIIRVLEITATIHEENEASEIVAAHREERT